MKTRIYAAPAVRGLIKVLKYVYDQGDQRVFFNFGIIINALARSA